MAPACISRRVRRRDLLTGGLILGASQIASPFIIAARAEDNIKIGFCLQDKVNKRMINADDKLKAVFGKPQVSMFEMAGLIGKHVK